MVSSSKKKRGKQRKAAKNQDDDTSDLRYARIDGRTFLEKSQQDRYAKLVSIGDNNVTNAVQDLIGPVVQAKGTNHPFATPSDDGTYTFVNISIEQSGILTTVLNFLKRCENETFHQVMNSVKGDLVSPGTWIRILSRAEELEPSCSLQIAQNIGPLVRCMCNDTERLFFQSHVHWKDGIMPFVQLISDLISKSINSTDKRVINTLIQHEGLLSSIVQWAFWENIHRPDIVRVLGVEDCHSIITLGGNTTTELILDEDNFSKDDVGEITSSKDGRKRLRSIGSSPIMNKDYDPTCTTSFVVGLIRLLKDKGSCHREPNSSILDSLIGTADCVDKDVITEVIDLGTNYASDLKSAEFAAKLSSYILCNEFESAGDIDCEPSDTRIAFAIRAGLIEICLNFIRRFGWHESFLREKDSDSLYCNIWHTLNDVSDISLHKKTNKALSHKKDELQNQLVSLEKIATSNTKVERLFDMVECILDNTGSYCCRCNKSLSKTEVMECNGCHRMTYCSKECQKEDWLNGHSVTCCELYTDATSGQFQGRVVPNMSDDKDEQILTYDQDGRFQGSVVQTVVPTLVENERAATKLMELEKNITSIQLKLFRDHAEYIKSQSSSLGISLWDCVAVFDLRCCPTEVEVMKYTDHYKPKAAKGFRKSRSKDNITCIYNSNIFNGTYAAKDDEDKVQIYNVPKLSMQKMFPHDWLLKQK